MTVDITVLPSTARGYRWKRLLDFRSMEVSSTVLRSSIKKVRKIYGVARLHKRTYLRIVDVSV